MNIILTPLKKKNNPLIGNTVEVQVITSKFKRKRQNYTGICISKKNRGINSAFTLRNVIGNVGVELTFPLHSPFITNILTFSNIKKSNKAKLYFLRMKPYKYSTVKGTK